MSFIINFNHYHSVIPKKSVDIYLSDDANDPQVV